MGLVFFLALAVTWTDGESVAQVSEAEGLVTTGYVTGFWPDNNTSNNMLEEYNMTVLIENPTADAVTFDLLRITYGPGIGSFLDGATIVYDAPGNNTLEPGSSMMLESQSGNKTQAARQKWEQGAACVQLELIRYEGDEQKMVYVTTSHLPKLEELSSPEDAQALKFKVW